MRAALRRSTLRQAAACAAITWFSGYSCSAPHPEQRSPVPPAGVGRPPSGQAGGSKLEAGKPAESPPAATACAGYPLPSGRAKGPAPERVALEEVDVNRDGKMDGIFADLEGGGALYLNCGEGLFYRVARSAARLQAQPGRPGAWMPISIAWEEDTATRIDGRIYRLDLLPFQSAAPADFLIEHDGRVYTLPFLQCGALGISAPRYRIERAPSGSSTDPWTARALHLELAGTEFRIDYALQEEYSFGDVEPADLNQDGALDAVLRYVERFGSGRRAHGGILLNCGDDGYVVAGTIDFGQVGTSSTAIKPRKLSVCGRSFTALVVERRRDVDAAAPVSDRRVEHDLHLYRPALGDFVRVASVPNPGRSTFATEIERRCAEILRRTNILTEGT